MPEYDHIHLDAVGGLAGDMFVAALLDALPNLQERVFDDLAAVLPAHCGQPTLSEGLSGGIAVRRFALTEADHEARVAADHHVHEQEGAHGHHRHDHVVRFPEMVQRISAADLHAGTADQAIAILRRLAEAESRTHRVPLENVHFHEIADWDSVMDLVAAGSIVAALEPCTWSISDLPLGGGLVHTRHGLLPVPAPATVEILRGFRWRDDGIGGERVTPTGAAIVAHLVRAQDARPAAGRLFATGTGAGTRELYELPNVLRVLVFAQNLADDTHEEVIVLSFDIDDMTGEELAIAADRLRAIDGVLDLSVATRQGKKGRPLSDFHLLLKPAALTAISARCFRETSTIGLRWRSERRICLPRGQETIDIAGQHLARKRTQRPEGATTLKVESDSIANVENLSARRRLQRLGEHEEQGE